MNRRGKGWNHFQCLSINILDSGSAPIPQTGNKSTTNKPRANKQEASRRKNNIGKKRSMGTATCEANRSARTAACDEHLRTGPHRNTRTKKYREHQQGKKGKRRKGRQ
jgi:hypothetical protein